MGTLNIMNNEDGLPILFSGVKPRWLKYLHP